MTTSEIRRWVADMEDRLGRVCHALADAQWAFFTTGEVAALEAAEPARAEVYQDPAALDRVMAWRAGPGTGDAALDRRLLLLDRELLQEAVACAPSIAEPVAAMSAYLGEVRAEVDGEQVSDAALVERLRGDRDAARREAAWRARAAVGAPLVGTLADVAEQRNAAAQALGFVDYRSLGLYVSGVSGEWLDALAERLEAATRPAWEAHLDALRQDLGRSGRLRPWDLSWDPPGPGGRTGSSRLPAPAEVPGVCMETLTTMGLPLGETGLRLDLEPRPGKSEHAWCIPVDPPTDIRVTASLARGGLAEAETLLHELGHAAQAAFVTGESLLLRAAPCYAFDEGVAQLIAWRTSEPEWRRRYAGGAAAPTGRARLSALRWWLLWIELERALYTGTGDTNAAFWGAFERILGAEAERDVPAFARVVHLVSHPIYLQNYLLADLIAAQLEATLTERFGPALSQTRAVGGALRDGIIAPGARMPWERLLRDFNGQPLGVDAWLAGLPDTA